MMPMIDIVKSIFSQRAATTGISSRRAASLAAIDGTFWRYQHFCYGFGVPQNQLRNPSLYPVHRLLALAYDNYLAVQIFWMLSGFVFLMVHPPALPACRDRGVRREPVRAAPVKKEHDLGQTLLFLRPSNSNRLILELIRCGIFNIPIG
jgi:hypothetical protein